MGIAKYDVPRPLRSQLVSIDTCRAQFTWIPFKRAVQSLAPVLVRLEKYYTRAVAERKLTFPDELPGFKLDPVYLEFLKREEFDGAVEL